MLQVTPGVISFGRNTGRLVLISDADFENLDCFEGFLAKGLGLIEVFIIAVAGILCLAIGGVLVPDVL